MPTFFPVKTQIPSGYLIRGNIFQLANYASVPCRGKDDFPQGFLMRQRTFGKNWDKILQTLKVTDTPNEILSELSQDLEIAVKTKKTYFTPLDRISED